MSKLIEVPCEECEGDGIVYYSDTLDEWEEEECDVCKGSGIQRIPPILFGHMESKIK